MADGTATFRLSLENEMTGQSAQAVTSLEELRSQLQADTGELKAMENALRTLTKAQIVDEGACSSLSGKIATQKQKVADLNGHIVRQGASFTEAHKATQTLEKSTLKLGTNLAKVDNPAKEELWLFVLNLITDKGVVGLSAVVAEEALHPHFARKKGFEPEGVGFCCCDSEAYGGEPLRLRPAPEIPDRFQRGAFLLLQEGIGLLFSLQQAAKVVNEVLCFAYAEGGLKHRSPQFVRQCMAEFVVHHHQNV